MVDGIYLLKQIQRHLHVFYEEIFRRKSQYIRLIYLRNTGYKPAQQGKISAKKEKIGNPVSDYSGIIHSFSK